MVTCCCCSALWASIWPTTYASPGAPTWLADWPRESPSPSCTYKIIIMTDIHIFEDPRLHSNDWDWVAAAATACRHRRCCCKDRVSERTRAIIKSVKLACRRDNVYICNMIWGAGSGSAVAVHSSWDVSWSHNRTHNHRVTYFCWKCVEAKSEQSMRCILRLMGD